MRRINRGLLVALATGVSALCLHAAERPNVVFILADDLGYGELGCYGQEKIPTPHIDALAADGMRFTRHYSGAPVCAPARCVLMTGKHLGHASFEERGRGKTATAQGANKESRHSSRDAWMTSNPIPRIHYR